MKLDKARITIDGLLDALSRGREAIREAADIMVALVDQDPRIYEKILKQDGRLSLNLLVTLEKVGRGVIYEALLFDSSPGARRLLTLPFSKQKEYYEAPVKIVKMDGSKKVEVEKPIQQLTPAEVRIAFSDQGLRSSSEQVKVIQENGQSRRSVPAQRYEILANGNLVVHFAETEFTPPQLQDIYERVREKAIKTLGKAA